ncbi:MAG: 2-amino-4-hydroxy-6-hydroxymethyldihydropteridine diphosphokinase [Deltaproteobacteria bacterium]|nr:2-amino-4-hydroxy-6-hydroxymethyldihydropteridine diphosphokinase [Deltaproteobacteria bacterium]
MQRAPSSQGSPAERAFVGLGSNLGDREAQLVAALRALAALEATRVAAHSGLHETAPVGGPPQGPYLNAVVELQTGLAPRTLLDALLGIEARAGRDRAERHGPRVLDLDLLLHGDRILTEPGLVVPHPRLEHRGFVLEPLAELAPDLLHPVSGRSIASLAERVRDPEAVRPYSSQKKEEAAWPSSP